MLFVSHPVAGIIHEWLTINNKTDFENHQGWHLNVVQRFWSRMAQTGTWWTNNSKYFFNNRLSKQIISKDDIYSLYYILIMSKGKTLTKNGW